VVEAPTSSWNSIAGRTRNAIANIQNAAEKGLAAGASGFLITDWGDCGHWQHLSVSYLGFLYGAAVGWSLQANREADIPQALDAHVFRSPRSGLGQIASDLGNAYLESGAVIGNATILFRILLEAQTQPGTSLFTKPPFTDLSVENLRKTRAYILGVIQRLNRNLLGCDEDRLAAAELEHAAALMMFACDLGLMHLHECATLPPIVSVTERGRLIVLLNALIEEQKRLWLARNRPGGLNDSLQRFQQILDWLAHQELSPRTPSL